ncbi:hypothetical protein LDENG_00262650 [Lucifuga dentata]|nr:hypothetical protein LDENG_00262650 [Lucifuga dentata]
MCQRDHVTSNDSSSNESARGFLQRHSAPSPTRVRFEDETEREAESRYRERQRQRKQLPDSEGRSLYWVATSRLHLRTEHIKETHIGYVTSTETSGGGVGRVERDSGHFLAMRMRSRNNYAELHQGSFTPTGGAGDLPMNPYANEPTARCSAASLAPPPPVKAPLRLNSTQAGHIPNWKQNQQEGPGASHLLSEGEPNLRSSSERRTMTPRSEAAAEKQATPIANRSGDKQERGPMKAQHLDDNSPHPEQLTRALCRDEESQLSLHRLFSAIGLRSRADSLDWQSSGSHPASHGSASSDLRKPSGS